MSDRRLMIGCSGPAGSGKSTLAKAVAAALDDAKVVSFAGALRAECEPVLQERLGISAWTQDPQEKRAIRGFLVARGAGRRAEDPQYWIKRLEESLVGYEGAVVIDDVRYANEAQWLRDQGGTVLGLSRVGVHPANSEERRSLAEFAADHQIGADWFHDQDAAVARILNLVT